MQILMEQFCSSKEWRSNVVIDAFNYYIAHSNPTAGGLWLQMLEILPPISFPKAHTHKQLRTKSNYPN